MIHESGWLQLGEPLVVGAKVRFPILRDGAAPFHVLFLCVVFFVAGLEEGFALCRASGLAAPYLCPPSEVNGEDHHSTTPRWGGVASVGLGCTKAYNGGWASRWLLLNCESARCYDNRSSQQTKNHPHFVWSKKSSSNVNHAKVVLYLCMYLVRRAW